MPESPYARLPVRSWPTKTGELVGAHPLSHKDAVEATLQAWRDILASGFGSKPFRIGVDMFPKPQVMAFFLHELIPLVFSPRNI